MSTAETTGPAAMRIERDIEVPMRDGAALRANLYRPDADGQYPVIVSATPYGKDVHPRDAFPAVWNVLLDHYPEVLEASSGDHMIWECIDPEVWVRHGYAVLQMDIRGTGKSAGFMDPNSPAEIDDTVDAVEWAGGQLWSNGSVGLTGLGYITASIWQVAARRPRHLKAIIPCQGTYDFYRDRTRNDGPFNSGFTTHWWANYGPNNQHGNPKSTLRDTHTGDANTGPVVLSDEELAKNRVDYVAQILEHPLLDDWYRARIADLAAIDVPALVVANWGGLGLQSRGTIAGWQGLGSADKWLMIEDGSYFFTFFTPQRVALLRRFFDRYLKGVDNDWKSPRVSVAIRTPEGTPELCEGADWPLPQTDIQRLHIDFEDDLVNVAPPQHETTARYRPALEAVTLSTAPLERELTLAGPAALRLWLACETEDTDLFVTVQAIMPDGNELTFLAAVDPASPLTQGWLRVSQRKLDKTRSTDLAPVHAHEERQALVPSEIYEVEVALWPTSLRLPQGSRLRLTIGGKDFRRPPGDKDEPVVFMSHDDPRDRPPAVYNGMVTLFSGPDRLSSLLLPALDL